MSSLREAIDNKCKDCIYDNKAPGKWKQQVELCTVTSCPLYVVRPRSKMSDETRAKLLNTPSEEA